MAETGMVNLVTLGTLIFGYILGSIPFGLILTRLAGLGDVRSIGSGNIGATNVLRTGNKKLAAATLLLDAFKGTIAVLIAARFGEYAAIAAGFGAFIGHLFPVWIGFKGGKGVATYLGILIGLAWPGALVFIAAWIITALLTRYSSLSALVATLIVPVALYVRGDLAIAALFAVMTVIIFIKHHANISRLLSGTESKIGKRDERGREFADWNSPLRSPADKLAAPHPDRKHRSCRLRDLILFCGSAANAIERLPDLNIRGGGARPVRVSSLDDAERELEAIERMGARLVGMGEPDYPQQLKNCEAPPPLVTIKGDANVFRKPPVAIVGSRNASVVGARFTEKLARDLGDAGFAIVSGLARGIDAAAHKASMASGTVAVLAGGLDRPYPPENLPIYRAIPENGGALITEMPMGAEPRADFPRRNRIIAGLSLGLIVIEAAERSGSLISARMAGEMGRTVLPCQALRLIRALAVRTPFSSRVRHSLPVRTMSSNLLRHSCRMAAFYPIRRSLIS